MGYGNMLPPLRPPVSEHKRNWILRVRYGPLWTNYKTTDSEDSSDDELIVKGKTITLSTFMRLPQITPRDVAVHRRQLSNGKRERISFMAINTLRRSVDDFHLHRNRSVTRAEEVDVTSGTSAFDFRRNSLDVRMPQTAPNQTRRRWSDGGATTPGMTTIRPHLIKPSLQRSLTLGSRGLNSIKSDSCVVQTPDEILREYREFARKRDYIGEGRIFKADSRRASSESTSNLSGEINGNILKVQMPPTTTLAGLEQPPKLQRRTKSKTNLSKHRRRILMPSGDSNGSRNSSLERIPSTTRSGTSTSLLTRKSSRLLTKKTSVAKKLDQHVKNKKTVPAGPDSPSGPSEEEMQELQELPVIRKFLKMPTSRPKVVCFDYPGVDLTHMDVKRAIEKVIPDAFESGKVVSIQFENVNVKLATGGMENRWLIELRDFATRNLLIKNGLAPDRPGKNSVTDLKIAVPKVVDAAGTSAEDDEEVEEITFPPIKYPKKVQVRLNDTVAMEEYKLYLRRTAAEEKLQNVILLCAGRGDKLLTTMI